MGRGQRQQIAMRNPVSPLNTISLGGPNQLAPKMLLSTAHSVSAVRKAKKLLGSRSSPSPTMPGGKGNGGRLSPSFPRGAGAGHLISLPLPARRFLFPRAPTTDTVLTATTSRARLPACLPAEVILYSCSLCFGSLPREHMLPAPWNFLQIKRIRFPFQNEKLYDS